MGERQFMVAKEIWLDDICAAEPAIRSRDRLAYLGHLSHCSAPEHADVIFEGDAIDALSGVALCGVTSAARSGRPDRQAGHNLSGHNQDKNAERCLRPSSHRPLDQHGMDDAADDDDHRKACMNATPGARSQP